VKPVSSHQPHGYNDGRRTTATTAAAATTTTAASRSVERRTAAHVRGARLRGNAFLSARNATSSLARSLVRSLARSLTRVVRSLAWQVLPFAVPPPLVQAARQAVDAATDHEASQLTADLREHPTILALFSGSGLGTTMEHAIGRTHPVTHAQVAVVFPEQLLEDHFGASATAASATDRVAGTAPRTFGSGSDSPGSNPFGWGGHIDGLNSFFHAEPNKGAGQVENPDDTFMNFDCLVGVALNDQLSDNSGNLGLLPRSHWTNAA
jgi:hypothetical protein